MTDDAATHLRPRRAPRAVRAVHGVHEPVRRGPLARRVHARRRVQRVRHAVHARALPGVARSGAARPVHREHAGGRARRRHGHRHAALRVHRPADARDAPRLVPRRVRAHRRRLAHPPALDHVHAQARRLRLRAPARSARRRRAEGTHSDRAPEDHQRRRPRRRARRTSGRTGSRRGCASTGRASSGRGGATSRSTSARRTSRR